MKYTLKVRNLRRGGGVRVGGVLTLASLANLMQLTSNIDAHGN